MSDEETPTGDHDLLVRIDERTQTMSASMGTFVTRREFLPVKSIVYGMVGLILASVIVALITLVIQK